MIKASSPFYIRPKFLFAILSFVNLLNFMDRGIIPGATNEFNTFIDDNLNTTTPDVYLGLLQSSFIVGFIIGSLMFGHMIHHNGRFFLVGIGMSMWTTAVIMSGLAWYANSYVFLVFARMLSGFGEASLQCTVPPWIEKSAPKSQRGTWLSIFFTAIPVGTACGYAYSSFMAQYCGWQWGFFVEALVMTPIVMFLFSIAPYFPPNDLEKYSQKSGSNHDEKEIDKVTGLAPGDIAQVSTSSNSKKDIPPSIAEEFQIIACRPIFLCLSFGYAAQTGALIGLSTFGSAFMMGLSFFDSESEASTTFGALVSVAGMLGTPLGGLILDWMMHKKKRRLSIEEFNLTSIISDEDEELVANLIDSEDMLFKHMASITKLISICSVVGVTIMILNYVIYNKGLYLFMVTIGCVFIFMCGSGINMGVMLSVPTQNRSFAIALMSVCIHAFGDVPSPIITGYMKDSFAPGCIPSGDDDQDNVAASDACRDDNHGLRLTMLIVCLWFLWTVVFFTLAFLFNHYRIEHVDQILPCCAGKGGGSHGTNHRSYRYSSLLNSSQSSHASSATQQKHNGKLDNGAASHNKFKDAYINSLTPEQQEKLRQQRASAGNAQERGSLNNGVDMVQQADVPELARQQMEYPRSSASKQSAPGAEDEDVASYYIRNNLLEDPVLNILHDSDEETIIV